MLTLGAAAAGVVWKLFLDCSGPWERLQADAREVYRPPPGRKSHVAAPTPGSFAELVEPHLDGLAAASESFRKLPDEAACSKVARGQAPLADLPAPCRAHSEVSRPVVNAVLASTRAERAGFPPSMDFMALALNESPQRPMLPILYAEKAAALDIRLHVQSGDAAVALAECLDALALAREMSAGALIGSMIAASSVEMIAPACGEAISLAPESSAREAAAAISTIAEGWTPFARTLKQEVVHIDLMMAGDVYPDRLGALPDEAARIARENAKGANGPGAEMSPPVAHAFMRSEWRALDEEHLALQHTLTLPPAERLPAVEKAHQKSAASWSPFPRVASVDYGKFVERFQRGMQVLDLLQVASLVRATRAGTGLWPSADQVKSWAREDGARNVLHFDAPGGPAKLWLDAAGTHEKLELTLSGS